MPLIQPASVLFRCQSAWNSGSNAEKLDEPSMLRIEVTESSPTRPRAPSPRELGPVAVEVASDMDRSLGHRERRFLDGLRQRRVRVTGARDILRGGAILHGERQLGDHGAGIGTDDVRTQYAIPAVFRSSSDLPTEATSGWV